MQWVDSLFFSMEMIGTASFALSGAMIAIQKKADVFGVLFLAAVTAVGGGIFRDMLIGRTPPMAFVDGKYVLTAFAIALLLFVIVRGNRERYGEREIQINNVNNIFDAMGLGAFTVTGVQTAQAAGHGENLFLCLFLGLMTGVGGGIIRDLMLQEIPFVLKKRIYAVASLLGGLCYWTIHRFLPEQMLLASGISVAIVFTIRMLATKYQWNLPKAIE